MVRRATLERQVSKLHEELGELVERHERSSAGEDYSRYADDPLGFLRDVLDAEPWSAQEEIAESVRDEALVVVQSANSIGKTYLAAGLALWAVYALDARVIVTSARQDQLKNQFMREVARHFRATDLPGELYTLALRLGQGDHRGILATTASGVSSLTGYHAPKTFVIADEAQGLDSWVWEGLYACATEAEDRILALGNPLSPIGQFYRICTSDQWHVHQVSALEHPNVTEGRQVVPGGPTKVWVERMRAEWGEGSDTFRSRVLGEFPRQSEGALFRREWLEEAARLWEDPKWRSEAADGEPAILGVDVARFGPDKSCVALRRGMVLEKLETWQRLDTMQTAGRVRKLAEEAGIEPRIVWQAKKDQGRARGKRNGKIIVDSLGPGAGVIDKLKEMDWPVTGFNGGHRVSGRFENKRVEGYWKIRDLLEAGKLALPREPLLWDELLATEWEPTPGEGGVRLIPKKEIRDRLGRSPDHADALVYAFSTDVYATYRVPFSVW